MNKRVISLTIYYLNTIKRNKGRLIDIIAWPVLELATFGFLSSYIREQSSIAIQTATIILGGLIFWHFFARTMNEIIMQLYDDILSRNLNNILITPLKLWEFISAMVIASLIKLSFHLLIILPISWVLFRFNIYLLGPLAAIYVFILTTWGISLGLITAASHFVFGSRAGAISWAIAGIIQPFSLVFYPRSVLPQIAQQISYFIPASYIFEAIRAQLLTNTVNLDGIYTAATLTLGYIVVAITIFSSAVQYSRKTGMITRL